jgi:hypothetical protein
MSIFYLPEGNIVTVVTLDTDATSNEFFGVYKTLNLAIADIKQYMHHLNTESIEEDSDNNQKYWELIDTVHGSYHVWKCKNSNQTKTFNFSRYGL